MSAIEHCRTAALGGHAVLPVVRPTAMHFRTHSAAKHKGKSGGQGEYNDVMVAHDENIGRMLAKLDELGIADDTIVMYSTDNGPQSTVGRMQALPRSAARRTPTGKAVGGSLFSCAGPARSSRARSQRCRLPPGLAADSSRGGR